MRTSRTIELRPEPATRESFAPFGVIPPFEGDGNPTADLEFLANDGWVNFIGHTLDEIEVRDGRLRCELLNRHDTHTQTLMPMSGDALVVVAPADVDFSEPGALRHGRGVRAAAHTCVHLHRGTWHWGPYPGRRRPRCASSTSRAAASPPTTASPSSPAITAWSTRSSPERGSGQSIESVGSGRP